jgi:hypothetical protein
VEIPLRINPSHAVAAHVVNVYGMARENNVFNAQIVMNGPMAANTRIKTIRPMMEANAVVSFFILILFVWGILK